MSKQHDAYMESLMTHIEAVREAGRSLGVSNQQLGIHDASKFSDEEFGPYARYFYDENGNEIKTARSDAVINDFLYAWVHHLHNNPHHWQHWIYPDGWSPENYEIHNGCLMMPYQYILEMVADWMGASFAYTGSWDLTEWLKRNYDDVKMHPISKQHLKNILYDLGYREIFNDN